MTMIYVPTTGLGDWQRSLADPILHWKQGKSAYECANSWEAARHITRGLPPRIASALDSNPITAQATLLIALPELRVPLPGGGHASQNDVWALLRTADRTISLSVEAKAGEPLGPLVREWLSNLPSASGKPTRLQFIRGCLGLGDIDLSDIRYQLLHRAASALVQAEQFHARVAVLLVHSFNECADKNSREDFDRFAKTIGCLTPTTTNALARVPCSTSVPFFIGWIGDEAVK